MSVSASLRDWLAQAPQQSAPQQSPPQRYGLDSYRSSHSGKSEPARWKGKDIESQSSASDIEKPYLHSKASNSKVSDTDVSRGSRLSFLLSPQKWKPSKDIMYNAIIGTSDGMTVPFAVTASLAGVTDARLVMMAGLAELIGGAISMSAGGVLGARTDTQKYAMATTALSNTLQTHPDLTTSKISSTFTPHLPPHLSQEIATHMSQQPQSEQLAFLLRFTDVYHECSAPTTAGVWKIALVLGLGYFSGLIPLIPYMVIHDVNRALYISIGVTGFLLAVFGYGKNALTLNSSEVMEEVAEEAGVKGTKAVVGKARHTWLCLQGSLECLCVVGVSAGLSVLIIRGVGGTL